MSDDVRFMVGVTIACAVVVGLLGWWAMRAARRVSLVLALVVAALVPFAAVVAAVWFNVSAMFLSEHDAFVVRLVLGTSSVLAVLLALLLGRSVARVVGALRESARLLADAPAPPGTEARPAGASRAQQPATAELARVVAELDDTRERLAATRERERAAQEARREVVAFLTHDLRSPLAGVRAAADGLRAGVFDERSADAALDGIAAAVDRMSRMIDDLAELSRAGGAPARPSAGPVDVGAVLGRVVAHALPAARAAEVDLECAADPGVVVTGDADELARVLDNLVANALRSSGPGGSVRVEVSREGTVARVVVLDSCGGISDADLPHLFREGYQGEGVPTGSDGLGLTYVDRVVDEHGGRVAVGTTAQGCRVEVRIPVTP